METDVLIWGDHPAGHVLGVLLASAKVDCRLGFDPARQRRSGPALLNEQFFKLDAKLADLADEVSGEPVAGVIYLSEGQQMVRHELDDPPARVVRMDALRSATRRLAVKQGVTDAGTGPLAVDGIDPAGVRVRVGRQAVKARLLVLAEDVEPATAQQLQVGEPRPTRTRRASIDLDVTTLNGGLLSAAGGFLLPMAINLKEKLWHGRVLRTGDSATASVDVPAGQKQSATELLEHFLALLKRHGVISRLPAGQEPRVAEYGAAGALQREGVGDRTLCIGPAGGFYSSTGEDLYPNCWSAVFAAKTIRQALKAPHPQDQLRGFRASWGATLGEYLQGPQQNLQFLESMVYDNPQMARRLAEAILTGRSVVR